MAAELPKNYFFVGQQDIHRHEVIALFRSSGWIVEPHEEPRVHRESEGGVIESSVGIRNDDDSLVAYGRLALQDSEWADMGDLMVHKDHRHKGLGKAIVAKRDELADSLGMKEITIDEIEPANSLYSFYVSLGFVEEQGSLIRFND